jgi:hypothetical protein
MKRYALKRFIVFLTALACAGLVQACDLVMPQHEGRGARTIALSLEQASMTGPALVAEDFSFIIDGTGPGGQSFHVQTAQGAGDAFVGDLVFGAWDITVEALYHGPSGAVSFGSGVAAVTVNSGSSTNCMVAITPFQGQGTLQLAVNWNSASVQSPVLEASLSRIGFDPVPLSFDINSGQATASLALDSGIYRLALVLRDGETYEYAGAADSVRITHALTTSAVYTLSGATGLGSVSISVSIDIPESIDAFITGASETMQQGAAMSLSASAPTETGPLYYYWYLNGRLKQEGPDYTIPASLAKGPYRVDLIIYTEDYSRSGAATCIFTVVE